MLKLLNCILERRFTLKSDIKTERLKDLFVETGWTQRKLASESGYTPQYVGDLLKGKKPIQKDCALTLAKCLKVRVEYLLGEDSFKTEREKLLHSLTNRGEQSIKFEELLLSLGYKLKRCESEDPLNDVIIITDNLTFEHEITEEEFEQVEKEIFDFIEFKIDRI